MKPDFNACGKILLTHSTRLASSRQMNTRIFADMPPFSNWARQRTL